jgi:hypothetical protein
MAVKAYMTRKSGRSGRGLHTIAEPLPSYQAIQDLDHGPQRVRYLLIEQLQALHVVARSILSSCLS